MPKVMGRDNHKCPGKTGLVDGYPGNCRLTNIPGTHCHTHQYYCKEHKLSHMKNKTCVACDRKEDILARTGIKVKRSVANVVDGGRKRRLDTRLRNQLQAKAIEKGGYYEVVKESSKKKACAKYKDKTRDEGDGDGVS